MKRNIALARARTSPRRTPGRCRAAALAATMTIDLEGTAFRLEQPFSRFGTDGQGTVKLSTDRKSLSQSVTGNCAWVAPSANVKPDSDAQQNELRLAFFPS